MARRKRVYEKKLREDPQYKSVLVGRLVAHIMRDGKLTVAQRVVYKSFDIIHERTKRGGLNVFEQAIKNVSPILELKSRRVGGANYQVPIPVSGDRRLVLAMRWIIEVCRKKKGKSMSEKIADECIDAANKTGAAMKKREDVHRMAEANKAFAHFA